ncbi:MAG TPA: hypothetical protein VKT12_05880 [Candidatus Binataceae bacterium]|nr:hypothetical protein [Candidatus Binataceae bacterium]
MIAAGVLAASLAALCHETLGHGLGCIGVGGHITLLTSIWFRCQEANWITDASGPIASLIGGTATMMFLWYRTPGPIVRLILLLFGGLSLFWVAGQLIYHPLINGDDWAFIAREMGWPWLWRPIMGAIGILTYAALMQWTKAVVRKQGAPGRHAVQMAYAASAASAIIAGLMWQPEPVRSASEGFLTLGIAPIGLLVAAGRASADAERISVATLIPRSWAWIALSIAVFTLFVLVQGRGLGSMAVSGLPR